MAGLARSSTRQGRGRGLITFYISTQRFPNDAYGVCADGRARSAETQHPNILISSD